MAAREVVFANLKSKFHDWLATMGVDPTGAGNHYCDNLEAIGEPMQPHTSPTGKWFGMYEALTGEKPKPIYSVRGVFDFAKNYGKAVSFFTVSKSFESARERIRHLYPNAIDFDALYTFAYTNGDNGHTRNGFSRYLEFLYELEAQVDTMNAVNDGNVKGPIQRISYGAPGTGKSKDVDKTSSQLPLEDVVRTTFHPDSDYSTFVGAYKPKMEDAPRTLVNGASIEKITQGDPDLLTEKRISYEFVPQAFAKAYVQAWKRMAAPVNGKNLPVMLVIEEINRGDCAKVFGDLFQLLDRRVKDDEQHPEDAMKKAGFSEYPVLADSDLADYIRGALEDDEIEALANAGYGIVVADKNLQLVLPPNMYIWATMNTSDQSLFPMDSAFKRRWDWKYTPIKDEGKSWKIKFSVPAYAKGGQQIAEHEVEHSWWDFLKAVNEEVLTYTNSEDKQLGYFFVKPTGDVIDADMFVNKVLFFLWNAVFKDCYTECEYFKNGDKHYTFKSFFKDDGNVDAIILEKFLNELMKKTTPAV